MKQLLTAFLLATLLLAQSSCTSRASQSSIAKINIQQEPPTLDPRKADHLSSLSVVQMLFDGLMRIGKEGKVDYALAQDVIISSDLTKYTFLLRPAKWSNGEMITANDFAYAWKQILSPHFPSSTASHFYVIKNAKKAKEGIVSLDEVGIHAINENTLVVELEHPTPYFLEIVSQPRFSAVCAKVDQKNPEWFHNAKQFVGNGPFILSAWEHQNKLVLKKNPLYWDANAVHLSQVEFEMIAEETAFKMFEQGELDWVGSPLSNLPLDVLQNLSETQEAKKQENLGTFFLRINTTHPLLYYPSMRKALGLAINREALVTHVLNGTQNVATAFLPQSIAVAKAPYFADGDLIGAKKYLAEFLQENPLSQEQLSQISFLYRQSEQNHLLAQAIQQQWKETLGIDVRLEPVEAKVFFSRIAKQDYEIAFGDWVGDFADPINFLEVFKSKESSNTCWENEQYISLLDQSALESNPEKRNELLASAESILMAEMPIIPLYHRNMWYMVQPRLHDVAITSMGLIDLKWASIQEN